MQLIKYEMIGTLRKAAILLEDIFMLLFFFNADGIK
jgi:hypothetical protein